jgi:hypothetical protein
MDMASEKNIKTDPTSKSEPVKDRSTSDVNPTTKAESSETAAPAPANYNRGEGQKPVSQAYRENWNAIFARTTKKKKDR